MLKGTRPDLLIVDEIAKSSALSPSARVMLEAIGDSIKFGTGAMHVSDFSDLEDRVTSVQILKGRREHKGFMFDSVRGGKSSFLANWYTNMYNLPYETVKANLNELQGTQQQTIEGRDPLFEAMELHNARVKAGKRAIRGLFEATPLPNFIQRTQGPIKARDWEK